MFKKKGFKKYGGHDGDKIRCTNTNSINHNSQIKKMSGKSKQL